MNTPVLTFFSNPKRIANIRINIIVVDFVIVYSDIGTNFKPQFEKPMSMPLAKPVGATFCTLVLKSMSILDLPVTSRYTIRIAIEQNSFITKWHNTKVVEI